MADMKIYAIQVGEIYTNCYLILNEDTREIIIVDPGDDAESISEKIRELEGRPVAVFLTHGHYDHILAVNDLREAYPAIEVYIGEKDAAMLKDDFLTAPAMEQGSLSSRTIWSGRGLSSILPVSTVLSCTLPVTLREVSATITRTSTSSLPETHCSTEVMAGRIFRRVAIVRW